MDVLFSTLQSFHNEKDFSYKATDYLHCIESLQLYNNQQGSTLNDEISAINTALNSSKSRLWGLVLLHKLLKQCTTTVFQAQAATWARLLISAIQSYDPPRNIRLSCQLLSQLLTHLVQFPEITREFTSTQLPGLVNSLVAARHQTSACSLRCLAECMRLFPGACGPPKLKIEQFVFDHLESSDAEQQTAAVECFVLLPGLGGGGSQGVKHTQAWSQHINNLLKTLNTTLDMLYQCVDWDESTADSDVIGLNLAAVSETLPNKTCQLADRYELVTKIIIAILGTAFPAVVNVPATDILRIIQRSLQVTPKILMQKPTTERVLLTSVLPQVYKHTLSMLQALVSCLGSNLVPHSRTVNQCVVQVLKTMSMTRNHGVQTPFSDVRACAWSCLSHWVSVVGLSSGVEECMEEINTQLIADISPTQDTVKATASTTSKKLLEVSEHFHGSGSGGKKRKKGGSSLIGHMTKQRKIENEADSMCCLQALTALKHILETSGPVLSRKMYSIVLQFNINTLLSINQGDSVLPYDNEECTTMLYKVLVTSLQVSHPSVSPPTHCAVNLLASGTKHSSQMVSCFCKEALTSVENISHPRAPSLNFPIIAQNISSENTDHRGGKESTNNFDTSMEESFSIRNQRESMPLSSENLDTSQGGVVESIHEVTKLKEVVTSEKVYEAGTSGISFSGGKQVGNKSSDDVDMDSDSEASGSSDEDEAKSNVNLEDAGVDDESSDTKAVEGKGSRNGAPKELDACPQVEKKRKLADDRADQMELSSEKINAQNDTSDPENTELNDMLGSFVNTGPDSE